VNSRRSIRRANGAFTIVEVLMAAVIMLVGVVGMIDAIKIGSEMLDLSRKQTIAIQVIHSEIDRMRLSSWSDVQQLPATSTYDLSSTSFQGISQGFSCTRVVSDVRTDLKKITYTVTWTGNTGRSYSRSSSTYVGKNGLYVAYQRS
jgi:Tfp pilus assembly protein PilV